MGPMTHAPTLAKNARMGQPHCWLCRAETGGPAPSPHIFTRRRNMSSSPGTGADLTPQEFMDILHKLITESTNVQAMFFSSPGNIWATTQGPVKVSPDGRFGVIQGAGFSTSSILFNPSAAVIRKWGDVRSFRTTMPPHLLEAGAPSFVSALCCVFADGSQLALFEIAS
jgi:hypothetical protein